MSERVLEMLTINFTNKSAKRNKKTKTTSRLKERIIWTVESLTDLMQINSKIFEEKVFKTSMKVEASPTNKASNNKLLNWLKRVNKNVRYTVRYQAETQEYAKLN